MLDLDAYFARIGWTGARTPTPEVLAGIVAHHLAAVRFENLEILLGRPILLDLASLQAKLVGARRGGYCFEQNTLLAAVLRELGFRVTTLAARVRLGVPAGVTTPRTHMTLLVELADGPLLVDVGFGLSPTAPLRLTAGLEQRQALDSYRLLEGGATWTLQVRQPDGWIDAYLFTEEPALAIDYELANHYTSTHPRSQFVLGPLVVRTDVAAGTRTILRGRELTVRRGGELERRTLDGPDQLLEVLAQVFDLPLPPGTRLHGTF